MTTRTQIKELGSQIFGLIDDNDDVDRSLEPIEALLGLLTEAVREIKRTRAQYANGGQTTSSERDRVRDQVRFLNDHLEGLDDMDAGIFTDYSNLISDANSIIDAVYSGEAAVYSREVVER